MIFTNESYFVKAYPMEKKSQVRQALRQFIRNYIMARLLRFIRLYAENATGERTSKDGD